MENILDREIKHLAGIGEKRAALMEQEFCIRTYRDLLYCFPYRYIDRTRVYKIAEIRDESLAYVQIRARVESIQVLGAGRKKRFVVYASDGSGTAELVWFQGIDWIQKRIEPNREYIFFGKPAFYNGKLQLAHPETDIPLAAGKLRTSGIYGMYSTTEKSNRAGINTRTLSKTIRFLWDVVRPHIRETLPGHVLKRYNLLPLPESLYNIHFPLSHELLRRAEYRLKFEELFAIQLNLLRQRNVRMVKNEGFPFPRIGEFFNRFYEERLPFPLTGAQKRVLKEIRGDLGRGKQMNRLLQGDVGSGKTVVALMSMLIAVDNGFQACMMAPTEILATQHYQSFLELTEGMGLNVGLLCGSTRKSERKRLNRELQEGSLHILLGTHALIEDKVVFDKLGLVVIDEQHRFGVEQRARLWTKSDLLPHILVMTATPIPRTLAMTVYGDLDVSVIDELPPGRKPIKTLHFTDARRLQVFGFMKEQIARGRQIYIVYPLVKESETMDYKNVEDGYESIVRAFPPPHYVTVIVHGQMKPGDKEYGMREFKEGRAHIMVATSVIEVGVNVPNASVMIIESAERFGLSQLHQLRGRVGRGAEQSYCLLMTGYKLSATGRKRIEAMTSTNDGFELAEMDLKLRGYGDIEGTRQSGEAFDLKIAHLSKDGPILQQARDAAEEILAADPLLERPENALLTEMAAKDKRESFIDLSQIS